MIAIKRKHKVSALNRRKNVSAPNEHGKESKSILGIVLNDRVGIVFFAIFAIAITINVYVLYLAEKYYSGADKLSYRINFVSNEVIRFNVGVEHLVDFIPNEQATKALQDRAKKYKKDLEDIKAIFQQYSTQREDASIYNRDAVLKASTTLRKAAEKLSFLEIELDTSMELTKDSMRIASANLVSKLE